MSVTTSNTYMVVTAELLRRTYLVSPPGDESRAPALAREGDYGAPPGESAELLDNEDLVCDCSILEVVREESPDA